MFKVFYKMGRAWLAAGKISPFWSQGPQFDPGTVHIKQRITDNESKVPSINRIEKQYL